MVDRLERTRPVQTTLVTDANASIIRELADYFDRRVGPESILSRAIRQGIGIHHGGVPQSLRLVTEHAFRSQALRVLIATNTIAQGVNFPAKTVIVHSLPRTDAPHRDFWNLVGRAGRAMRETEGEVLILKTGALTEFTLDQFLDRDSIEAVESRLLQLVRRLLNGAGRISSDTVDGLLVSDEAPLWNETVGAVDAALLDSIAEDVDGRASALAPGELDAPFLAFVESLFAMQQARIADARTGTVGLENGLRAFMEARRASVLRDVPDGATRKRYVRVGLSVQSSIYLDAAANDLRNLAAAQPLLTDPALSQLVQIACGARELSDVNPAWASPLAWAWMQTGSYLAVWRAASSAGAPLKNLDEAVGFVERVLVYRLPWVFNGILRGLEDAGEPDGGVATALPIPEWIRLLPQFLRYGVNTPVLVWIMSLGVQDVAFAQWLLAEYVRENGTEPATFRGFLEWALSTRQALAERVTPNWPRYFRRLVTEVLERYARLQALLRGLETEGLP
jgi:hypothetical protein